MKRIVNLVIIGLLLIGLVPLACVTNGEEEEEFEVPILEPGGLVTGVDGVTVGAPEGALNQTIEIFIEKVDDPRGEVPFPEYLAGAEVVGDFYAISADQDFSTSAEDYLILGLPVPEGVSTDELALVCLVPPGWILTFEPDDDPSIRWSSLQGRYDAQSELFGTLLPSVLSEPQVFALIIGLHQDWTEVEAAGALSSGDITACQTQIELRGFRVVSNGFNPTESPAADRVITANALNEARTAYIGMGFPEPYLRRFLVGTTFSPPSATVVASYVYELRKAGDLDGGYNPVNQVAYTTYSGTPVPEWFDVVAHHELFHAIQAANPKLLANWLAAGGWDDLHRTIDAAATAVELSLTGLTRSNWPISSREPHPVDHGLWSSLKPADAFDYAAQDFLVYIGKALVGKALGEKLAWMRLWFSKGGLEEHLDESLDGTPLKSLGNAYWEWAKNQAFEKQYPLGFDSNNRVVPHGKNCSWSGHGNLTKVSFSPETWTLEPAANTTFPLPRLTSKVFELDLHPYADYPGSSYNVTVNVSTTDTDVKFKFYEKGEEGDQGCWDTPDNAAHTFQVGKNVTAYVLVSNTDRTPGAQGESGNISLVVTGPEVRSWDASIGFDTWTINGVRVCPCPVSGNVCNIIDAHFRQWVDGRQGYNATLNETSWLNITQVAGPSGVQVFVVDDLCAVNKTPEPIEKVSQVASINNSAVEKGNSFNLTLQVPTVLDVRTVWKLVNCLNYTKAINWFGISRFGTPHQCVLFELRLPGPGQYKFKLEASAELALVDDVDVALGNNKATSPPLLLTVLVE